ncbi:MAG: hypothetical protein JWO92_1127 [Chitinophagaceae bacterium]|nr:hypothetical protein [Chitinophagaceae bacterium]
MKKINDYLPFYLGCEIRMNGGAVRKLTGIEFTENPGNGNNGIWLHDDTGNRNYFLSTFDIKLLLRPLSDMTVEESIELFKKLSLYDLNECVFDIIEDEDSFCINAELEGRVIDAMSISVNSDIVEMMNNDGPFLPVNPQSQAFYFFLSKHFDLFGLIEAGLAIDATTINK